MITKKQNGFILASSILLILGITAITVGTIYNNRMSNASALNYKHKLQTFLASDGLMTLLSQEMINDSSNKYIDTTSFGTINGKLYLNISGSSVQDLKNAIANPNAHFTNISSNYLGSSLQGNDYGIVWTGWIIAPLTGPYRFYVRSNKASEFWLSTDASESHLSPDAICVETGFNIRWAPIAANVSTVSSPIQLEAGKKYFFKYYHKQNGFSGTGQVGWDGPDGFMERPISGNYITNDGSPNVGMKTTTFGNVPVRYSVTGNGLNQYQIQTEAFDLSKDKPNDTAFRALLQQSLSLQGAASVSATELTVPVIYYDYTTFKPSYPNYTSYTEFGPPTDQYIDGVTEGMVQDTLTRFMVKDADYFGRTAIPKPNKKQNTKNRNCGMNYWFQESASTDTAYKYPWNEYYGGNPANFCDSSWVDTNTFNPKTKHKDHITFTLDQSQGPGAYVFSRLGNENTGDPATSWQGEPSQFFPLDTFGLDTPNNAWPHNYGFCVELHTDFHFNNGLNFQFVGDDDVWVFINNKLVIDLGGIHAATPRSVQLDDLPGLQIGKKYTLDFYQCEREPNQSASRIVTNMITPPTKGAPHSQWKRDYGNVE